MAKNEAGLWVPASFHFNKMRPRVRTVTLRDGQRAKVTRDDSGTVFQVERNDGMDAVVRPRTVTALLLKGSR